MTKTLSALSDRFLGLLAPKARAGAQAPCMQTSWCEVCDLQGTYWGRRLCMVNGSCTAVTCTTCLINSPDC